jgi:hypothetical protein
MRWLPTFGRASNDNSDVPKRSTRVRAKRSPDIEVGLAFKSECATLDGEA